MASQRVLVQFVLHGLLFAQIVQAMPTNVQQTIKSELMTLVTTSYVDTMPAFLASHSPKLEMVDGNPCVTVETTDQREMGNLMARKTCWCMTVIEVPITASTALIATITKTPIYTTTVTIFASSQIETVYQTAEFTEPQDSPYPSSTLKDESASSEFIPESIISTSWQTNIIDPSYSESPWFQLTPFASPSGYRSSILSDSSLEDSSFWESTPELSHRSSSFDNSEQQSIPSIVMSSSDVDESNFFSRTVNSDMFSARSGEFNTDDMASEATPSVAPTISSNMESQYIDLSSGKDTFESSFSFDVSTIATSDQTPIHPAPSSGREVEETTILPSDVISPSVTTFSSFVESSLPISPTADVDFSSPIDSLFPSPGPSSPTYIEHSSSVISFDPISTDSLVPSWNSIPTDSYTSLDTSFSTTVRPITRFPPWISPKHDSSDITVEENPTSSISDSIIKTMEITSDSESRGPSESSTATPLLDSSLIPESSPETPLSSSPSPEHSEPTEVTPSTLSPSLPSSSISSSSNPDPSSLIPDVSSKATDSSNETTPYSSTDSLSDITISFEISKTATQTPATESFWTHSTRVIFTPKTSILPVNTVSPVTPTPPPTQPPSRDQDPQYWIQTELKIPKNMNSTDTPKLVKNIAFLYEGAYILHTRRQRRAFGRLTSIKLIYVRIDYKERNMTLVYVLYYQNRLVPAVEAVEKMSVVRDSDMERLLGHGVIVKAKPYEIEKSTASLEDREPIYKSKIAWIILLVLLLLLLLLLILLLYMCVRNRNRQKAEVKDAEVSSSFTQGEGRFSTTSGITMPGESVRSYRDAVTSPVHFGGTGTYRRSESPKFYENQGFEDSLSENRVRRRPILTQHTFEATFDNQPQLAESELTPPEVKPRRHSKPKKISQDLSEYQDTRIPAEDIEIRPVVSEIASEDETPGPSEHQIAEARRQLESMTERLNALVDNSLTVEDTRSKLHGSYRQKLLVNRKDYKRSRSADCIDKYSASPVPCVTNPIFRDQPTQTSVSKRSTPPHFFMTIHKEPVAKEQRIRQQTRKVIEEYQSSSGSS